MAAIGENGHFMKEKIGSSRGTVLQVSRRRVLVTLDEGESLFAAVAANGEEPSVGDVVVVEPFPGGARVLSILGRRSLLRRSYFGRTKNLAANVGHLLIITAPGPLFNTHFIDRALVAAAAEGIPTSLIINKIDLGLADINPKLLEHYRRFITQLLFVSCRANEGVEAVEEIIAQNSPGHFVFCGVSGVGKSSLLNRILPNSGRSVGEVSRKTGQGKQTTSLAVGIPLRGAGDNAQLIIDTPGLQHFGLTHLLAASVPLYLPDLSLYAQRCEFRDCRHTVEPSCAVRKAVEDGDISPSRYESYLHITEELRSAEKQGK